MPSLHDPQFLRDIIMDHYQYPRNHGLVDDPSYTKVNMNSSTCIDNIDVQVKLNGNLIEDIRFDGEACAICTSSTSIMSELLKDKTIDEAKHIMHEYFNMIHEQPYDEDVLEEAVAFQNTYKQANRIKCATLGWKAVEKIIGGGEEDEL